MFAARSIRLATKAPRLARGYAEAQSDKLRLSLVLPHQTIFKSSDVLQVNIAAASGDMGILANHVPSVESLKPGVLEVIEANGSESKKWFVSGGFANVHPNNLLTVNAVEACKILRIFKRIGNVTDFSMGSVDPVDAFSQEAVRSGLAEAQRVLAGSGDATEKAEAQVEVEVFEALQVAMKA